MSSPTNGCSRRSRLCPDDRAQVGERKRACGNDNAEPWEPIHRSRDRRGRSNGVRTRCWRRNRCRLLSRQDRRAHGRRSRGRRLRHHCTCHCPPHGPAYPRPPEDHRSQRAGRYQPNHDQPALQPFAARRHRAGNAQQHDPAGTTIAAARGERRGRLRYRTLQLGRKPGAGAARVLGLAHGTSDQVRRPQS